MKRSLALRRLAALAVTACLLLTALPAALASTSGLAGSGTASDPWIIDSEFALTMAYQMMLEEHSADHFLVTKDITLTKPLDNSFLPSSGVQIFGASQAMVAPGGVFDGGGHTISNLVINSTSNEGGGFSFFEYNSGTIRNLNLVYAGNYVYNGIDPMWGGLVDYNSGSVSNCSVTAHVTIGSETLANMEDLSTVGFALIAGSCYDGGTITNCTAKGSINGPVGYTAGVVANDFSSGGVTGCTDLVSVNGQTTGSTSTPDVITVTLDGQLLTFDQPPMAINGRTLVPFRTIFEALGAEVEWDPSDQSVFAYRASDGAAVLMYLNVPVIGYKTDANSEVASMELDVSPTAVNNRTLVPVRVVAEVLNCTVDWDQANMRVIITTN